jgi:hypothetical protein
MIPALLGKMLATNRLKHGTAQLYTKTYISFNLSSASREFTLGIQDTNFDTETEIAPHRRQTMSGVRKKKINLSHSCRRTSICQSHNDIRFYVDITMSSGRIQLYIEGFIITGNWKGVEYPSWLWAYITQQLCHIRHNRKAE